MNCYVFDNGFSPIIEIKSLRERIVRLPNGSQVSKGAILVGNGINQYGEDITNRSWKNLLSRIAERYAAIHEKNICIIVKIYR